MANPMRFLGEASPLTGAVPPMSYGIALDLRARGATLADRIDFFDHGRHYVLKVTVEKSAIRRQAALLGSGRESREPEDINDSPLTRPREVRPPADWMPRVSASL